MIVGMYCGLMLITLSLLIGAVGSILKIVAICDIYFTMFLAGLAVIALTGVFEYIRQQRVRRKVKQMFRDEYEKRGKL